MIRAVVSDFGGVLTAPLLQGFRADPGRHRRAARGIAVNVEAARALGFKAVHFRDTAAGDRELDALIRGA